MRLSILLAVVCAGLGLAAVLWGGTLWGGVLALAGTAALAYLLLLRIARPLTAPEGPALDALPPRPEFYDPDPPRRAIPDARGARPLHELYYRYALVVSGLAIGFWLISLAIRAAF